MSLRTDDYDYELPERLIAKHPMVPRDESRLLVLDRATGKIEHLKFTDLPRFFDEKDLLVANDTRVLRARLLGHRLLPTGTGGAVEMLLLEKRGDCTWEGAFHSSGRPVPGFRFQIENGHATGAPIIGEITVGSDSLPSGTVVARFDRDPVESGAGELPLPHYLDRPDVLPADEERYQTVFAKSPGSAAAPTAGLHFTPRILERLRERGAGWSEVTLHVGLGTFRPVKAADITAHVMHEERYEISASVADRVLRARGAGGRITAVGTTAVRTLESAYTPETNTFLAGEQRTGIFIYPGGRPFRVVDRLITNFHLPKSTLLMLVSAFAGRERTMAAYAEAVREGYRFFSYGDAMLIL